MQCNPSFDRICHVLVNTSFTQQQPPPPLIRPPPTPPSTNQVHSVHATVYHCEVHNMLLRPMHKLAVVLSLSLQMFGCGSVAQLVLSGGSHGMFITVNFAFGFAATLGILVCGQVSGTHIFSDKFNFNQICTLYWSLEPWCIFC